jgi:hypothetical protein
MGAYKVFTPQGALARRPPDSGGRFFYFTRIPGIAPDSGDSR